MARARDRLLLVSGQGTHRRERICGEVESASRRGMLAGHTEEALVRVVVPVPMDQETALDSAATERAYAEGECTRRLRRVGADEGRRPRAAWELAAGRDTLAR